MADTETFLEDLTEARERTLALVSGLDDDTVERVLNPIMSPLVWDLAHIAAYEDLWLGHNYGEHGLLHPELAQMYDAFETPRVVRGDLPLLNRIQAVEYLEEVRARSVGVIADRGCKDSIIPELVLRHEEQHNETMLQTLELAQLDRYPQLNPPPPLNRKSQPSGFERIEVTGGECIIGALDSPFSYDNERPRFKINVPTFYIGRTPISNGEYLDFITAGGYERDEWWSNAGWQFRERSGVSYPHGWRKDDAGWQQWHLTGWHDFVEEEPVIHISWFEADAFARAHGARLPTEIEWEKAARWCNDGGPQRYPWGDAAPTGSDQHANLDQSRLGVIPVGSFPEGSSPCGALDMIGNVWEWTSSDFNGYNGFVAHPYREYSEVFFGSKYKVLRGESWATRARVATPTFRNWDLPERRQIFAGVRLAWDK